jgi:hypothetical protein
MSDGGLQPMSSGMYPEMIVTVMFLMMVDTPSEIVSLSRMVLSGGG